MRRRALIAMAGALLPGRTSHAQTSNKAARVAVITGGVEGDSQTQARLAAFRQAMASAGWREGQNLTLDVRYDPSSQERARALVAELLALKPDVALIQAPAMQAMREADSKVPAVFALGGDPVAFGWVASLARPGGRFTGLTSADPTIAGKWVEFLKEVAPGVRHVAAIWHLEATNYWPQFDEVSKQLGIDIRVVNVDTEADIERAIAAAAAEPNSGLVLPTNAFTVNHRARIVELTLKHRLPTVSGSDPFAEAGALVAYAVDTVDVYRRAADYVDRILRGAAPGELPVQQPTRYRLTANLRTARALGLTIPQSILARADNLID